MHYGLDIAYNISTALGANTGLPDSTKAGSDISPCPPNPTVAVHSRIKVL